MVYKSKQSYIPLLGTRCKGSNNRRDIQAKHNKRQYFLKEWNSYNAECTMPAAPGNKYTQNLAKYNQIIFETYLAIFVYKISSVCVWDLFAWWTLLHRAASAGVLK